MSNYKTYSKLVSNLGKEKIYFNDFTLTSGGDYLPDDIDWNYKDVLHAYYVHSKFTPYELNFTDTTISHIFIQKLFGLKFPIVVYQYDSGTDNLTYVSTFLNFIIITNTKFTRKKNKTYAITKYNVGSSKIFIKLFFPLIKYVMTKNYNILMQEDEPMRRRRGQLRKMGAEFVKYGDKYTHIETMEINKNKCKFKASLFNSKISSRYKIIKKDDDDGVQEFVSGQSDIWGLRGLIENNKITIYPRMCDHEGACLDEAKVQNINLVCPWHNKKIKPIHSQNLNNNRVAFSYMNKNYQIKISKNNIKIKFE